MSFWESLRVWKRGPGSRLKKRRQSEDPGLSHVLEQSRVVSFAILLLTVAGIVVVSFVGVSPAGFQILPGQQTSIRIIASKEFSYESRLATERRRDHVRSQVPPVFRIEMEPLERFGLHLDSLLQTLATLDDQFEAMNPRERADAFSRIADEFTQLGAYRFSASDLATLYERARTPTARQTLFQNARFILREIHQAGIYDTGSALQVATPDAASLFFIKRDDSQIRQARIQSMEEALTYLRINLGAENVPPAVISALFRLFSNGVRPNLIFDAEASYRQRDQLLANLRPEIIRVEEGRSIIEPGMVVTEDQHEMLTAFQRELANEARMVTGLDRQLFSRVILVMAMVLASIFYIRLEDRETLSSNGRMALLALVVVFSLFLVRTTSEIGTLPWFVSHGIVGMAPFMAPVLFAPLVMAVLVGPRPALFVALQVSLFTGVIHGNRLDLLVIFFLASTIAVFICRRVRRRGRLVSAGGWAGFAIAMAALLLGLADKIPLATIGQQMLAGQATGLLTAIAVAGLLPVLETLFKRTTDITLLELSDYNHPLLRRMQLEAPGSYHHSLMVASLSENAANAIGANALLTRVCAVFHDIGKLVKPEYFVENQKEGINPHDEKSPSFSALVIKSHVKEGLDLAINYRLPRPVKDVIRQHHGTTLIYYFFRKARENERKMNEALFPGQSSEETDSVLESTYRYDGPKPQFRESAIIFLADSIEAASRSLSKISPQSIQDLIDKIIKERLEDNQLDESPLTLAELAAIKQSFSFTLLNSLHARIAYPSREISNKATPRTEPASVPTTETQPADSIRL